MNEPFDPMDGYSQEKEDFDTDVEIGPEAYENAEGGLDDGKPGLVRGFPTTPPALHESIERLDALLAEADNEEKIKAGMGIRLALGMAQELKSGKPLGSETSDLVAGWVISYGQDAVETAVRVAREFLVKPETMRRNLGERLGRERSEAGPESSASEFDGMEPGSEEHTIGTGEP